MPCSDVAWLIYRSIAFGNIFENLFMNGNIKMHCFGGEDIRIIAYKSLIDFLQFRQFVGTQNILQPKVIISVHFND